MDVLKGVNLWRGLCQKGRMEWAHVHGRHEVNWWKKVAMGAALGVHWIYVVAAPDLSWAVLNSPVASLPRTAEAALRRSVPVFNADVEQIQRLMESISFSLRIPQRKPWGTMNDSVEAARMIAQDSSRILKSVPEEKKEEGAVLVDQMLSSLGNLQFWVNEQNADMVSVRAADVLSSVADLQLLQAPGLPYLVPRAYSSRPRLAGRAVVRLTVQRNGTAVDAALPVDVVLDGYSAPVSAGAFAKNVVSHAFDQQQLVVDANAIVLRRNKDAADSREAATVPLEILPMGQFEPIYRMELDVQAGDVPVLPLSIFGSVALSHSEDGTETSSPDEAFIFKFDRSSAGLGGMAFDEGKFSVVGYVTKGLDTIDQLRTGDAIVKAEIIKGEENLIVPKSAS